MVKRAVKKKAKEKATPKAIAKQGAKGKGTAKKPIEAYDHRDKARVNYPPVGLVTPDTDPDAGRQKTYEHDPHLDPKLVWAGKAEHTSFDVSKHLCERTDGIGPSRPNAWLTQSGMA